MKTILLFLAAFAAGALHAAQINGALTIAGGATLDGSLATADEVSTWLNPTIQSRSGNFVSFTAVGQAVTMTQPWQFDPSVAVASLWSVGGFTFDLASSSIVTQNADFLGITGAGLLSGNGFDVTPGIWRFTTQSPDAAGVFSFSASTEATPRVPDGGNALVLLGAALGAVAWFRRRAV